MKKACMFPGQGVQFTGMMKEEYCNKYSKYIKSADDILGYSIVDICNNKDRAQMLNQTEFTQPAMYIDEIILPEETREKFYQDLVAFTNKEPVIQVTKKHGNIPL